MVDAGGSPSRSPTRRCAPPLPLAGEGFGAARKVLLFRYLSGRGRRSVPPQLGEGQVAEGDQGGAGAVRRRRSGRDPSAPMGLQNRSPWPPVPLRAGPRGCGGRQRPSVSAGGAPFARRGRDAAVGEPDSRAACRGDRRGAVERLLVGAVADDRVAAPENAAIIEAVDNLAARSRPWRRRRVVSAKARSRRRAATSSRRRPSSGSGRGVSGDRRRASASKSARLRPNARSSAASVRRARAVEPGALVLQGPGEAAQRQPRGGALVAGAVLMAGGGERWARRAAARSSAGGPGLRDRAAAAARAGRGAQLGAHGRRDSARGRRRAAGRPNRRRR